MTEQEKINRIATEIMGWVLGRTSSGRELYRDSDGEHFIMFTSHWNPLTRWDHAGMVVAKAKERFGYIFNIIKGPFENDRWIVNILSRAEFADRKTVASAIETGLPAAIVDAALGTLEGAT